MGIEFTRQDLISQGFSQEEIDEYEKKQRESSVAYRTADNASRIAGIVLGTANAPLSFIKGAMNADIANPEEFKKMSFPGQMATQFAGGLESAWRSISKKGDWGEDYDTYYKAHSGGATLQDTFGEGGSMLVKMGLDLMMDPLFGPALAIDLAKKGITTLPHFAKYLAKGALPEGAELRALTEGFPKTNLYSLTDAEKAEMAAMTEQERMAAITRLRDTLQGRKTELMTLADEEAAAQYGYSTLHGTATDETGVVPYLSRLKESVQGDNVATEQIRAFEASLGDVDGPAYKSLYDSREYLPMVPSVQGEGFSMRPGTELESMRPMDVTRQLLREQRKNTSPTGVAATAGRPSIPTSADIWGKPPKVLVSEAKEYQNIMPTFQGGKESMALPVTQAVRKTFTPAERNMITEINDYFGGGSNWGTYHALTNFPNANLVRVYERNPNRIKKIQYFHERGNQFMADYETVRSPLEDIHLKMINEDGVTSATSFARRIENAIPSLDEKMTGLLQAFVDYGMSSYGTKSLKDIVRILNENAKRAFNGAEALRVRGGKFEYINADSYGSTPTTGSHVLSIIDPPYYNTRGYGPGESIVGAEIYGNTSNLLKKVVDSGNNVIYTDSAWWLNKEKVPRDVEQGNIVLDSINGIFNNQLFAPVPKKIGAGRDEVLGVYNAYRKSEGESFNAASGLAYGRQADRRVSASGGVPGGEVGSLPGMAGGIERKAGSLDRGVGGTSELNAMSGGMAGIEEDEEGNLTFDIKNGLLGMAAGVGAKGIVAKSSAGRVRAGLFGQILSGSEKAGAARVARMYDKTVVARAEREASSWAKTKDALVRGFVDRSGNFKREAMETDPLFGKELVMEQELHAGSTAIASNMNEQYQKSIFRGLSSNEQELLNSVIQSKRIIEIDDYRGLGVTKHPDGLTGVEHLDYLAELERKLPQGVYADLEARANLYFDAMQEQLQYRLKEGLITQEQFTELSKHIYSPRQFMQHLDDSATAIRGGKKISVSERGGIHALDEGSMGLLENNAQRLLQYNVNMTQDMISRNKANRALLDFVQANPGNGIATEAQIVKYTKEGAPVYAETPAGHELIRLFVDGQEKILHMPKEMAQEWITADPMMNHMMSTIVQWLTGTKLVKAFATGYNPAFALSNIPRDVALVWGSTDQYSQHLPIALGQLARDFTAVAGDVMKRQGRVIDYIKEGGGTELLTYYGRLSQAGEIGEKVNTLGQVLGWVGETSEIWTRIALRERALRNGLSPREATWQARHYLDFSQGGNIAKGLDNAMPYLNAGIQGTRSIFRYAASEPGRFAYKMGQLGAISMGLYLANYMTNPETWAAVSDRDKEANFIITTPFTYADKDGQLRRYYVKIAKDQGQRAFCTFFEGLMEAYFERKIPGKRMAQALGEFVGVGSMPPVFSALLAYAGNKDAWNWQDVWRGPKDVEPGQEYTADTHPLAVAAGQVTNLSPERGTRALGSIMPPNNAWVGLVSGGLRYITDGFNPKYEQETMEQMIMSNPSVRRILSTTSEINRYRSDIDQIKTQEVTRRFKQSRELDKMTTAFFQDQDPAMRERIYEYVQNAPAEDQDRLVKRVVRHSQTAQLPDGQWWRSVGGLPTSARAEAFLLRFESESPIGQARMLDTAGRVSGFYSDNFIKACILLKEQGGPKRRGILPQLPIELDQGELE